MWDRHAQIRDVTSILSHADNWFGPPRHQHNRSDVSFAAILKKRTIKREKPSMSFFWSFNKELLSKFWWNYPHSNIHAGATIVCSFPLCHPHKKHKTLTNPARVLPLSPQRTFQGFQDGPARIQIWNLSLLQCVVTELQHSVDSHDCHDCQLKNFSWLIILLVNS